MLPETVARLSEIENIVGLKEATGDLRRVAVLRAGCGDDFALFSGDDLSACDFLLLGGNGVISVTANLAPRSMQSMCEAALSGDRAGARAIDRRLEALHRDLFVQSNPIPVKWAAAELGLCGQGIRLPLTWLSEQHHARVRAALEQAELL
jgi:4-hydroxy-tetrahydrodipicolinate synthase